MRIHPAIIAQAAATAATMMPGRFSLGVGTGENLNEHILGQRWPSGRTRLAMLEEAVEVIQLLWQGGMRSYQGRYFTVENARLYTLPDEPPRLLLGAGGPRAAALAARIGDGLVTNGVSPDIVAAFNTAGGATRPRFGMVGVCWAESESVARRIAFDRWPTGALAGGIHSELPLPRHFEQVVSIVTEDDIASSIVCGPDPDRHLKAIHQARAAGYDHVCIAQVGPDQEGFFHFYEREVLPQLH
jgi:G6PDH family F420-dependent oxidoreductase